MRAASVPDTAEDGAFHALPTEIIDMIAENLDLHDLQSIRLASKEAEKRFTGPAFLRHFEALTTDLSRSSLERLSAISSHPTLSSRVKRLTVVATVYDTRLLEDLILVAPRAAPPHLDDLWGPTQHTSRGELTRPNHRYLEYYQSRKWTREETAAARADLKWLREMQHEQKEQGVDGHATLIRQMGIILGRLDRLDSLEFDSAVVQGRELIMRADGHWVMGLRHPLLPRLASTVLQVAMAAAVEADIKLQSLKVYPTVRGCSIESRAFAQLLSTVDLKKLAAVVAHVKDLALSFSPRTRDIEPDLNNQALFPHEVYEILTYQISDDDEYRRGDDPLVLTEDNFEGIPALLKLMPRLETLDFHLFNTLKSHTNAYDRIFETITQESQFPQLTRCTLRGLHTTEALMLRFLNHHPQVRFLELRYVSLTMGTWSPIFAHLSRMPYLDKLRLSNLFAGSMVNLAPKDKEAFEREIPLWRFSAALRFDTSIPCVHDQLIFSREFDRETLRRGLEFTTKDRGHHLPSMQLGKWVRMRKGEFGFSYV